MITVNTDAEGAYPDASDERLSSLVSRLGDDVEFVIVEARDDAPGFAQALKKDAIYTVEFQDGSGEQWQCITEDECVVTDSLTGWARDRTGWRDLLDWKSIGRF